MYTVSFAHFANTVFGKSWLFHQKLLLIHMAFSQTVGLVWMAQQLISPPKELPPIFHLPGILQSRSLLILGINSSSIKLRQASPLPPNFQDASQLQVYQLFLLLVFQIPTTTISSMFPAEIREFRVFCIFQAPKADLESQKRFWPSCINRTGYVLQILSWYDGGQQMEHLRELLRMRDWKAWVSTTELMDGLKLGYTQKVLGGDPEQIINSKFLPIIQLVSFSRIFIWTGVSRGQLRAQDQMLVPLIDIMIPLDQERPHPSPLIYSDWTFNFEAGQTT